MITYVRAFATSISSIFVPTKVQEAISISKWRTTIEDKMSSLQQNGTLN